ncbi:MAG: alpha/beta hydrolase [Actinobacteria bacterium]|nr:MAG: alpha/beta hydrolase [Actinomycetota bacterium]
MSERILIHAGIADSRMYRRQVETLAPARAFDLPGFGAGPPEGDTVDYRQFVRDVLPPQPATLIGTSLGGRIALELALESPERIAALVLVGPGLDGHEWSDEVRAFGAEEEEALERGDLDGAVEANLKLWLADDVDPDVRALVADMQRTAFEHQVGHEPRVAWLEPPASTRLGDVRVPTLVVTGDEDVRDIHLIADRLVAEIPGAERATIAGSGHLPSLERPDDFDRVVLAFLGKHGV